MSAKREGLERIVKGVAKVVDDWGWKGGKKGEISGTKFISAIEKSPNSSKTSSLYNKVAEQMSKSSDSYFANIGNHGSDYDIYITMGRFDTLQRADVPRAWTGKIAKTMNSWERMPVFNAFRKEIWNWNGGGTETVFNEDSAAQALSDLMRPMTNDQRETFLNLLPRWTGTLETAASAAKKLYRR